MALGTLDNLICCTSREDVMRNNSNDITGVLEEAIKDRLGRRFFVRRVRFWLGFGLRVATFGRWGRRSFGWGLRWRLGWRRGFGRVRRTIA
jgi:hypothetical protein